MIKRSIRILLVLNQDFLTPVISDYYNFLFPAGFSPVRKNKTGRLDIVNLAFFDFKKVNGRHIKVSLPGRHAYLF